MLFAQVEEPCECLLDLAYRAVVVDPVGLVGASSELFPGYQESSQDTRKVCSVQEQSLSDNLLLVAAALKLHTELYKTVEIFDCGWFDQFPKLFFLDLRMASLIKRGRVALLLFPFWFSCFCPWLLPTTGRLLFPQQPQ